jgi:hypothetical protein
MVVEQAKGVLIERLDLPAEALFELLRSAACRSRRKVHTIAAEILASRTSPAYIEREIRHLMGGNSRPWQDRRESGDLPRRERANRVDRRPDEPRRAGAVHL